MQGYLLAITLLIIEVFDIVGVAARFEMYKELKYIIADKRNEIPIGLYSSICFYLIPDYWLIKFTKIFPLTYFFDRKIKNILKDKTYDGENVLERLERIKNIKWDDIKDKKISIK